MSTKTIQMDRIKQAAALIAIADKIPPDIRLKWCATWDKNPRTVDRYLKGNVKCSVLADNMLRYFMEYLKTAK